MNTSPENPNAGMETLVGDAQQLIREASFVSGKKADEMRDKGLQLLDKARIRAQDAQAAALDTGKAMISSADALVKGNTWQAMAISGAAGVLIGFLIARR